MTFHNSGAIDLSRNEGVAIIKLNRPDSLNALGLDGDGAAFERVCGEINADIGIRCAIITGAGRAFSAGGDLKQMQDKNSVFRGPPAGVREAYRNNVHRIARSLFGLEAPLIAAVNGPAIGLGCDIACMADIRIAADTARFGVTFLKVGLIPGDGGAWLLPRVVGASRAAELLYTGDIIGADVAREIGLVSQCVLSADLMEEAMKLARCIAMQPPQALRATKMLLRQSQNSTYEQVLELSAATQASMHATSDHDEGVNALLERRTPVFTGR